VIFTAAMAASESGDPNIARGRIEGSWWKKDNVCRLFFRRLHSDNWRIFAFGQKLSTGKAKKIIGTRGQKFQGKF